MIALAINQVAVAQSNSPKKKAAKVDQTDKQKLTEADSSNSGSTTYDTGETIGYLSDRMVFQLKKRLHLTDEKDEEEEKKAKQKAGKGTFTVFGITIEKH